MGYYKVKNDKWYAPKKKNHLLACCDCGLVHKVSYRIVKGQIQAKYKRDEKNTKKRRKKWVKK
jgi:hypothetical protein